MKNKWRVKCDDEVWFFDTRNKARKFAKHLKNHPANKNIRAFGPYKNADGIVTIKKV